MTHSWTHDTERYRYATREDIAAFAEMLADPEVGRWLWFTPLPPDAVEAYFGPFIDRQAGELDAGKIPQTAVFTVEDLAGGFLGDRALDESFEDSGLGIRPGQFAGLPIDAGEDHRKATFVSSMGPERARTFSEELVRDAVRALEPIGPAADRMAGFANYVFESTWRLTSQP